MRLSTTTSLRLSPHQSSSALGDETVVLNVDAGAYYELDPVGSFVWALLRGEQPVAVGDIEEKIRQTFDVDAATCHRDLVPFLIQLLDEHLIQATD